MNRRRLLTLLASLLFVFLVSGPVSAQTKAAKTAAPKAADLIDINSATKDQLMTLAGIGDALSQKIIDNRPYRAKNQLIQKKIIPQSTYDKISAKIIAKQATVTKKTP